MAQGRGLGQQELLKEMVKYLKMAVKPRLEKDSSD